jgi:hypothetical protein
LVSEEQRDLRNQLSKSITFIPLKFFAKYQNDTYVFKQQNSELFYFLTTVGNEKKKIQLILDVDLSNKKFSDWVGQFFNEPQCVSGDNIQELCEKDIIKKSACPLSWVKQMDMQFEGKSSERYVQGSKGFFEKTLKEQQEKEQKQKKEADRQKSLFYSRLKKLCGYSLVVILMYALYQKLYAIAG